MNDILEVTLRTLFTFFFLMILTRLDGPKQISQLNFHDYIVGIIMGSLGASLCFDLQLPGTYSALALLILVVLEILSSKITMKSIKLRRFIVGNPKIIIDRGSIRYKGLTRSNMSVADLMKELRFQGYFNLSDIQYAILETNGQISVMPKVSARPLNTADMNLKLEEKNLNANIIIDGKILNGNLETMGKTEQWVFDQLKQQQIENIDDVIIATLDDKEKFSIFLKDYNEKNRTILQ